MAETSPKDPNANKHKAVEDDDDDDGEYSCKKCCRGYGDCIVVTCKCIYKTIIGIKDCIKFTIAAIWYPIKERCCTCCENCEKKSDPYKDPYFNPYDTL